DFSVLSELAWMLHTESDANALPRYAAGLSGLANALSELTSYVANFNAQKKLVVENFSDLSRTLAAAAAGVDFLSPVRDKLCLFLAEADEFVSLVYRSDLNRVHRFIEEAKVLFKEACGVRHVDFIAYKPQKEE